MMKSVITTHEPTVMDAPLPTLEVLQNPEISQTNGAVQNGVLPHFPRQGEWTYEHWLQFPNDGWKYEIIDGVLYMSPPPTIDHQYASMVLGAHMHFYAHQHRLGIVLASPCGVRLPGQSVPLEPDLFFVSRERRHIIHQQYVEDAPDLVVEVLSRSSINYDRDTKYHLYEQAGIPEYWIVNYWDRTATVYQLIDGVYTLSNVYLPGQMAVSQVLAGFTILVDDIFTME